MLTYNQPFALYVCHHGYLKYKKRQKGINLGWSNNPIFEWEFRRSGASGDVQTRQSVALLNKTAHDYIVYQPRRWGINLKWLHDTNRKAKHDWKIVGQFPNFRFKNLTVKKDKSYLIYGARSSGIELVWGKKPNYGNFHIIQQAIDSFPSKGDHIIGEKFAKSNRFRSWSIEYDGVDGLDFDFYNTTVRSPYIQNVTQNSATVLWRVGIPKGWDPIKWVSKLKATASIESATDPNSRQIYRTEDTTSQILAESITHTYKYEKGVTYDHPVPDGEGESNYWLNNMSDRPVIQFKVIFRSLKPGEVYHYSIISQGVLNEDDNTVRDILLADDVYFKTAPKPTEEQTEIQNQKISFLAMGDLGPGNGKPSYFYDVFDLLNKIARYHSPNLWLALGDIDNDTDGHPNAMDPFFFSVYNAYRVKANPHKTSHTKKAKKTTVRAFRKPPYYGLLGGLPVFPTFGNHDICENDETSSLKYWEMAYKASFELPSKGWCDEADAFNTAGEGFFYTFRYGNVIFISLGIPQSDDCNMGNRTYWKDKWGAKQKENLILFLKAIKKEIERNFVWVIAYFHDHNSGLYRNLDYAKIFLSYGVDLVLMGHDHFFRQKNVHRGNFSYRAVVVGTGGFGDRWGDPCHRPGFILIDVQNKILRYWKYDTHKCDSDGSPKGPDALESRIKEYCRITKIGLGNHIIEENILNRYTGLYSLRVDNRQYVCAEGGGGGEVVANRKKIGEWETFGFIDLGNDSVALKSHNGQYLCAEGGGGGAVVANRDKIGVWETFKLINLEDNYVALKSHNGQYLCAEGGGGGKVVANRNAIKEWEKFELFDLLSNSFDIKIIRSSFSHVMFKGQEFNFTYALKNMGYMTAINVIVKLELDGLIDVSRSPIFKFHLASKTIKKITRKLKAKSSGHRSLTITVKGWDDSGTTEFYGKRIDKIIIEGGGKDHRYNKNVNQNIIANGNNIFAHLISAARLASSTTPWSAKWVCPGLAI